MTEFLFYHLQNHPLERALPALLEKSLDRGWRVVVQAASEERVEALDAHLWTFRDDSPNGAAVRFLLDGAALPIDANTYERIVLLFDGEDTDAVEAARKRWSDVKASGFNVTYWQPDERGRWQRKA